MRTRARLVPLLVAGLLLLAGCSSDTAAPPPSPADDRSGGAGETTSPTGRSATTPEDRLAAAPAATVAAGSARTLFTATLLDVGGAGGDNLSFSGEGEIDFEGGRASSRSDLTELLRGSEIEGVDGEMESVVDGAVSYVRSALFTTMVGAPTPWIRIDPAALESATGMDMTQLSSMTSSDPNAQLSVLAGVMEGSVEEAGSGEVRGTPTSRFRATVDLRKAAEDTGAVADPEQFEQFITTLGSSELAVEVDLDDDDRVRRLAYEHRLPAEGGGGRQQVELEYFDFGAEVDIALPPADQVTDLVDLFGDIDGGGG